MFQNYSACFARWSRLKLAIALLLFAGVLASPLMVHAGTISAGDSNSKAQSMAVVDSMMFDTENTMISASDFFWHHGDYPRIIHIDRVLAEMDPTYCEGYSTGGWLMESGGDLKNAEAFYRLGVSRNMKSTFMAYQLAFFYFNTMHKYDKAVNVLKRSTQLPDADDKDWKMLAHSYAGMKDYKDALATWKIVKQRFPNSPAVDHNLQEAQAAYDHSTTSGLRTQ